MKKPTIFNFIIWNPFKKGLHICFILFLKKEFREYFLLLSIGFIQISIDFEAIHTKLKTLGKDKK
jgi:hypothetical protein